MKPITPDSHGAAVEDVQRRLNLLGYPLGVKGIDGVFGGATLAAIRDFRASEGLPVADIVDDECWAALVDATFSLGDRSLYLRLPYFHGADVLQLQSALNVLGFTSGDSDGIFGPTTERALREFQGNAGISPDGIAGSLTFNAITRLHHVWEGKDGTPHSAANIGFSRAAEVLEREEVCFFGTDEVTKAIASRLSNLASATTPDSKVTSADSLAGAPSRSTLLIQLSTSGKKGARGVPFVGFDDDDSLAARIRTAASTAKGEPLRMIIDIPTSFFVDIEEPTVREKQHVAVTLLDACCEAFA